MQNRQSDLPPAVTLERIRLTYGGRLLFDQMSLELLAACWTCLLGPSGVGKTSLLRVLAGLGTEENGHNGETGRIRCSDDRPLAGRVAYMAQRDLLLPWLNVLDNVTLGHRIRGDGRNRKEVAARARAMLHSVGLAGREDDAPNILSSGQRQRVALARTLMEDRSVVLMDEPFSALDAITRHRLQALAGELLQGKTVLLVTHDPLEALRLGHRIHVMAGRPARLDEALVPAGATPRELGDGDIVSIHRNLLDRLAIAAEATAAGDDPGGFGA